MSTIVKHLAALLLFFQISLGRVLATSMTSLTALVLLLISLIPTEEKNSVTSLFLPLTNVITTEENQRDSQRRKTASRLNSDVHTGHLKIRVSLL